MLLFFRIAPLFLVMTTSLSAASLPFFVGTYTAPPSGHGKGIYRAALDTETGALSEATLAVEAIDPTWLALADGGTPLYAALEGKDGGVASYWVAKDGSVQFIQNVVQKETPCHLSLDAKGKFLLSASYGAGTVFSFATEGDPALGIVSSHHFTGTGPIASRQKESHAHSIYLDKANRFAYACDLGGDDVALFAFDAKTGALEPKPPFAKVPPGSGPRHLAFSPDQKFAYVNGEMAMNVTAFSRDLDTGALTPLQTVPMERGPEGDASEHPSSAEVVMHPSGKWLLVSNRGWNTVAVFAVGADGRLSLVANQALGVKDPRGFALDPSGRWIVAGGQKDDAVVSLKFDPATGQTAPTGQRIAVGSPVAFVFAP